MAVTYRPSEITSSEIERLKTKLGISTTTKLIDFLILDYQKQVDKIYNLNADNFSLRTDLNTKTQSIDEFLVALDNLRG